MARKKEIDLVRCYDCKFARLMRSSRLNPIVAHCTRNGERNMASTTFPCVFFKPSYEKIVIHPMEPLK